MNMRRKLVVHKTCFTYIQDQIYQEYKHQMCLVKKFLLLLLKSRTRLLEVPHPGEASGH